MSLPLARSRYSLALRESPIRTRAVTGAVLSAIGNVLAQKVLQRRSKLNFTEVLRLSTYGATISTAGSLLLLFVPLLQFRTALISDWLFLLCFSSSLFWYFAALVVAGSMARTVFFWLKVLDRMVPPVRDAGIVHTLQRVFLDQLLFAPAASSFFFCWMNITAGTSSKALSDIRAFLLPTLKAQWKVWPLLQFINFRFVPLEYKVLFGNLVAFFWNIYLSSRRAQVAT